jgi:hypothetical protein
MSVSKDGYAFRFVKDVRVEEDRERELDVALERAATLHLRITDAQGDPVVGQISLGFISKDPDRPWRLGIGAEADEQGRVVFKKAPPGTYEFKVRKEGAGRVVLELELLAGENTRDVVLQ